jgi:hypothetical protein
VVFTAPVGFDYQVFAVSGDGSGRTQLSPSEPRHVLALGVSVGGTGPDTWVVYSDVNSTSGPGGLFRVKADGTGLLRLTSPSEVYAPSISADGNVAAWLLGDAFVMDVPTMTIHQLTNTSSGYYAGSSTRVTQNGSWVFAGEGRYDAQSYAFEPSVVIPHSPRASFDFVPNATGSRWVTWEYERLDNHPGYSTFFLSDMNAVPAFSVSKTSPTELSWDPSPTSLRYDVIRGSVANLSVAGSTVSLGPVSCLEDDSPDSHTRGYGDPSTPAPGQAFFFLYRGSVGANAVAGSYGQGTGGRERLAGSGGCNP